MGYLFFPLANNVRKRNYIISLFAYKFLHLYFANVSLFAPYLHKSLYLIMKIELYLLFLSHFYCANTNELAYIYRYMYYRMFFFLHRGICRPYAKCQLSGVRPQIWSCLGNWR